MLKSYVGCKILSATPMTNGQFLKEFTDKKPETIDFSKEGYLVVYPQEPNDYYSWSPKAVFDTAYREVTLPEAQAVIKNECTQSDE